MQYHHRQLGTLFVLLTCLWRSDAVAAAPTDEQAFNQLLELLDQQTTIATRTRLNADYVPGMVSILHGDELRLRGFATLWDALDFIPGVIKNIDATGKHNLIVRGIGKKTETSKIKILLNNIPLNASIGDSLGTLLDMPVLQIERIEFIRGPGSAIHGEFALMGVLNVITHRKGGQVAAGVDSEEGAQLYLMRQFGQQNGPISGALNIAATNLPGEEITTGSDRTAINVPGYAPGPVNNKREGLSAILNLDLLDYNLLLQYQESNRGDHFGINNYLPPPISQTVISDRVLSVSLEHHIEIAATTEAGWRLQHLANSSEKNGQFLGVAQSFGQLAGQDDIVSDVDLQEQRNALSLDLRHQQNRHRLFGELSVEQIEVTRASQFINLDPATDLPDDTFNAFPTPVNEGEQRDVLSLVLQDEYSLNPAISITAGLRYDEFNDDLDNLSPRLALVWRGSADLILKFQYAEAYRPPTLREVGGALTNRLEPETIETTEASLIHDGHGLLVKHTLFYSTIDDFIAFRDVAPLGYLNIRGARLYGYELELNRDLGSWLSIQSSLSLLHSEDRATGDEIYGAAPWMLTVSGLYRFGQGHSLNLQLKSRAGQQREQDDTRADSDSLTQVDISYNHNHLFGVRGLRLTTGIRNLLQQEVNYAAPRDTYADDYVYSDNAIWWVTLGLSL